MRLPQPFVKLPIRVDADRLAAELDAIDPAAWRPHPEGAPGNTALALVAAHGNPADDAVGGPMRPTPHLAHLPYAVRVLGGLHSVIGRTRFMRIEEEGELNRHVDSAYYWREHLRIHVPVVSSPDVVFECGRAQVNMRPGEVWAFDTWRPHRVENPASHPRTHLVIDTVGSAWLWDRIDHPERDPVDVGAEGDDVTVLTESGNVPLVMTPWELDHHVATVLDEARRTVDADALDALAAALLPWQRAWREHWAAFGDLPSGWNGFRALRDHGANIIEEHAPGRHLPNGIGLDEALRQFVIVPAVAPEATLDVARGPGPATAPSLPLATIERPVFVVSPPRSGSTMLFEALARARDLFTVGGESHGIIEGLPRLHPRHHDWDSNRLTADDAAPVVVERLRNAFAAQLRDRDGVVPRDRAVRMLEKTPKNALRVPFLAAAFPDATFVSLYRDPRETLSSMIDAWRSGSFVTYRDLPGWAGELSWSMLLVPGWRDLAERSLPEIVAAQWATTTTTLLDDLEQLDPDQWCVASYSRLLADPQTELARICEFCDITWDVDLDGPLPISRHTLDSPAPEKWRRNAESLDRVWSIVEPVAARAREIFGAPPRARQGPPRVSADAPTPNSSTEPDDIPRGQAPAALASATDVYRSVHAGPWVELLTQLDCSLLTSTYQSGRLIIVRTDGTNVNTHFRSLREPMGIALRRNLLAVGTRTDIHFFQNQPQVTRHLDPALPHDACFMPRHSHTTGDLRVHDLVFAGDDLWLVNTRFSCLATLDATHSFVPRWRPPFVTALSPDDRCHLNGLAVVDTRPRYVTALGTSDEPGGWREHKVDGGVIMDVDSSEVVAGGLCMPHSPRWHDGRLWVLESGRGALGVVDLETGAVEEVAVLPGFTRGLSFVGSYAFVGLSQVREHLFDGLPLTADGVERNCGVWVVDVRTGAVVAFVRFEGLVQELFEVAVLPGIRFPELAEPGATLLDAAYVLPDDALTDVPEDARSPRA